jgi:hypothetical protein
MARHRQGLAVLLAIAAIAVCFMVARRQPARPKSIPEDSAFVHGGEDHWWERCSCDTKEDTNRCQVFNARGAVIWNEVFLPYEGGKAAKEAELQVDGESRIAGPQYVCLKNGRILIPKSSFESFKEFLDRTYGQSKVP